MVLVSMGEERTVLETKSISNHGEGHFSVLLYFYPFHQYMWGWGGF